MRDAPDNGLPPAGWYADPQAPGRERWWNGVAWGEHGRAEEPTVPSVFAQRTAPKSSHTCPQCESTDIKTLKIIRAHGTSTGTATTAAWVQGVGNQQGHMGAFRTTTKNYTDDARAAAPPRKRFNGVVLIVFGIALGAILGRIGYALGENGSVGSPGLNIAIAVLVGSAIAVGGAMLAIRESAYNRNEYPEAHARWERSWQCQRCGTVFLL